MSLYLLPVPLKGHRMKTIPNKTSFALGALTTAILALGGCPGGEECMTSGDCAEGEQCVVQDDGSQVCEGTGDTDAGPGDGDGDGDTGPCDLRDDCGEDDGRPTFRSELSGVYDPTDDQMIIFGGVDVIPENCGFPTASADTYLDETWSFKPRCGTWNRIGGLDAPPARSRHMMTYDPAGHRVLVFGGRFRAASSGNYSLFNDLWELDLDENAWSQVQDTNPPSARVSGGFVVNGDGTKAYVVMGNESASGLAYIPLGDVWELDLGTMVWTDITPAGGDAPADRLFPGAIYDPGRDWIVVYSGANEEAFIEANNYRDMWAFDVNAGTWTMLHDGAGLAPQSRFWTRMSYDPEGDQYFLFGGHDDTNLGNANDLWTFDPITSSWNLKRVGDTWANDALGFCDFPPDFTNVDMEAPERRNAHVQVYADSDTCPGLIVSMGKTDCGNADDVWRWNVDEDQWQELVAARAGEMCLRADRGFDCFSMCD